MAVRAGELRQCQAEYEMTDGKGNLRCQGEVTEQTTHIGDHWAYVDAHGNKLHWTEAVAVYPVAEETALRVALGIDPVKTINSIEKSARLGQVGGEHYRKFKIQPWDVIDEYGLSFYAGNALKYLLRAGRKGSKVEDLKKCRHYLDKLIEIEEGKE